MFKTVLTTATFFVACCCVATEGAKAQDISSVSFNKAKLFLETKGSGEYILGFAHFGATYKMHQFVGVCAVKNRGGNVIPGEFALVYDFDWDAGGPATTRMAFLCDKSGKIEDVQALSSTAVVQQPFTFADATIQLLSRLILEAFKEKMNAEDIRQVEKLVASADSEGLLEFGLTFRQALGVK